MTDQELLAVLAEKTPDELTEAEIDLLRRRLTESAELREALLSQVQMETYLAAALARVNFSTQDILDRAQQHRQSAAGPAAALLGITLTLLALVGMFFLLRQAIWGRPREPDLAAGPKKVVDATDVKNDAAKTKSRNKDETSDQGAASDTDNSAAAPAASASDAATEKTASPSPATTTHAPAPPWQAVLHQENVPAFSQEAFRTFDVQRQLPRRTDLLAWFEAVPGHNYRITEVDTQRGKCGQMEGLARLRAPWTADSAIKVSLENYNRLQLHFFHGLAGVTLVYYEDQQYRWAAYATTRQAGKARPQTLAITATDDDRCRRSEIRFGGPIEIRHRGGELILSRGNVVLLSAPLPGPPDDVYFEGRAAFHGLELIRTQGDPQPLAEPQVVFDSLRPADLAWTSSQPDIAPAESLEGGSLRLRADKAKQQSECYAALPMSSLCEVIVELDDVSPGTSVFLGADQGASPQVLRFFRDQRTGQLAAMLRGPDDFHEGPVQEFKERPAPLIAGHFFVRIFYGAGNLRWWLSSDGIHWAQLDMAQDAPPAGRRYLGLQVVANRPDTHLTLKRIILRELNGLAALAPAEVRQRASGFPTAASLGDWLADVTRLAPTDVDAAVWRRACAIRTLGAGAHRELAHALLELLLDDAAERKLPTAEQIAALNDAMLLVTDLRDGQAMRLGLTSRYLQLARMAFEEEEKLPWSTIQHAYMSVPLVTPLAQPPTLADILRWELIDSVSRKTAVETLELCRQWRFFQLQQQAPLLEWAETATRRDAPGASGEPPTRLKDGWRPLLVEEVSKDTYNAITDARSVLESEAWEDAAGMLTSLGAENASGVAPWLEDKELLVSLPVAIQLMLDRHPPLREALQTRFAPVARLRMSQAIAAGDSAAVELAAMQFAGTEAAAEAHRWLGDQALASGWFARAIAEYRRAIEAAPALAGELSPRIRLAAAMLGRDAESPPTQNVRLGEVSLTREQFESLVAEMRGRGAASLPADSDYSLAAASVPAAAAMQAQTKARLDGNVGDKPQEEVVRRTNQFRVPWVDRQIAAVLEGDLLYVSNRFQVAAYNLASGQRLWQSPPPPGPMKPAQDWAMIAMRPLITPQHIFARQLYGQSPQLVCLSKADGKIVWAAGTGEREFFVSDPLLVQGQLVVLSIVLAEGEEGQVKWNRFDAATGELQEQRDLVRLRKSWGAHACCEVAALEDSLVAVLGGVTLAVDAGGRLKWVRKQVVLPAEEEPRWILQRYQRPLVDGERLYVAQPGVRSIECLDARTGTRHWLSVLPDLLAISGLVEGKLIAWTESDLRALDAASGKTLWRRPATDLHSFQLCGPSGIVFAQRESVPGMPSSFQTRLVWLEPAGGNELGSAVVPQFTDADPRLGPLVAFNNRLWTFFGKGQHEPTRDIVELTPSGEPERRPAALAGELWLKHVPPALTAAAAQVLPQWQVLSGQIGDRTGLVPEVHGETNVLGIRTNPQWPIAFARPVSIPAGAAAKLRLRVGNDAGHHWKVEVRFGDRLVQAIDVTDQAYKDRWKTLEVDLSSLAGQRGTLVVCGRFVSGDGNQTVTFWKSVELVL
ncbi:MAG TPA: PQQ-binding-like beta-propeller repeat protein [Pirellulaceae bacterium]|nr:PQQ-binding-like beta-propeller repeat protein [Pirellulaceae bacterium]